MTPFRLWVYLQTTPLFWLTATLAAFLRSRRRPRHPLSTGAMQPRARAGLSDLFQRRPIPSFPVGTGDGRAQRADLYQPGDDQAQLLAARGVARHRCRRRILSAVLVAKGLGAPRTVLIALAPKSITAGVAMAVTEGLGGPAPLTGVLVIATGILGAVIVTPLMNALGVTDYAARGFAVGLASHGIGTARAFAVDPVAGVFAGLAMGLNAVVTPAVIPAGSLGKRGDKRARSPPRIALLQKLEQPPRRLDLAARGPMGARLRVPGVDVEMRPRLRLVDEAAKEQRRGDRPRHAPA